MTIQHDRVAFDDGDEMAIAYTFIDGVEHGSQVVFGRGRKISYETAKQEAELNLLQYLERNKIHARNPGEKANG